MKKVFLSIFPVAFVLLAGTCRKETENTHYTIKFHNRSSIPLYVEASFGYPDTFAFEFGELRANAAINKVNSGELNTSALGLRGSYEYRMENYVLSKKVMVYVFDAAVIESTPLDTIRAKYLVLKRYDLSLDDLRARNWTIEYP